MKKQGFLAFVLSLALFSGCATSVPTLPETVENNLTVAYVPLDDRPVNDDRVAYLAGALGFTFLMPERSLYHTALDGQDPNPNGSAYGDRGALWDWVMDAEANGCDVYVLSMDQLFSGGLVNSRVVTEPIAFADGTQATQLEVVDTYLMALAQDPDNQIYLIDTVMRLAPTVGYLDFGMAEYETLRAYGMTQRPVLEGESLTVENIINGYPYDAQGALAPADASLSQEVLDGYHQARAQKLTLIDTVLKRTADCPNVQFLIGVDDSAPSASIQTNELAYLRQAVAGRGAVLSGADEDGMLALCRVYSDLVYTGEMPTVTVRYFGGSENVASSDYDHQPMTENVDDHLAYLNVTQVTDGTHDLEILVLTAPSENASESWEDLLVALQENEKSAMPTVLVDAAKHAYGTTVQEALIDQTQLGMLFGYGGYYDLANVTGVSVANGLARWLSLAQQGQLTMAQHQDFARTLADSLLKDLCYKNDAKVALTLYVNQTLEGDANNFATNDLDMEIILAQLEIFLEKETQEVIANLEGSNLLVSLDDEPLMGWGDVTLDNVQSPWQRAFEVRYDILLTDFGAAHARFWSIFG